MSWENEEYVTEPGVAERAAAERETAAAAPRRSRLKARSGTGNLAALRATGKNWGEQVGLPPNIVHRIEQRELLGVKPSRGQGPPRPLQYTLRKQRVLDEFKNASLVPSFKMKGIQRRTARNQSKRKALKETIAKAERSLLKKRLGFGSRDAKSLSRAKSTRRKSRASLTRSLDR